MSTRRDYILRMIEQMGAVFARLRQMILGGGSGVEEELRKASGMAGVDLGTARVLDGESLLALLAPAGQPDATRIWVIAELLYLDGLDEFQKGRPGSALASWQKALKLYTVLDPRIIGGIPEAAERIPELERRVEELLSSPPSAA
jgi:hypothetical protein